MASPDISSVGIPQLLSKLKTGEWVVPAFQRPFRWDMDQVAQLAWSVLRQRPIGMATLWESIDRSGPLEPRSVRLIESGEKFRDFCDDPSGFTGTSYEILDGQQRCTAIAMAFGGLRTTDSRRKTTGRFFADLRSDADERWVFFKKEKDVQAEGIATPMAALAAGYLQLQVDPIEQSQWDFTKAWSPLLEQIASDSLYEGDGPSQEERDFRKERVADLLSALTGVKLATYTVDSSYSLGDICEIFETLNQTGTKVSTVDLIHSFVLQESTAKADPMDLRAWLDELGAMSGAEGWSSSERDQDPERVAQAVTASYIGLVSKPEPRPVGGEVAPVRSIKSPDLLRTPTDHWLNIRDNSELFAGTFGMFQDCVAGARFPRNWCPYVPGSISVYFGLAWSWQMEDIEEKEGWQLDDLNVLFKSFFWRNALSGRYDQGFLTQSATDMGVLREMLKRRPEVDSQSEWLSLIEDRFETLFGDTVKPERAELAAWARNDVGGARRDAILLAIRTRLQKDLVTQKTIAYPTTIEVDMHHIWPIRWIKNNKTGKLAALLDEARENDWNRIDCPANKMPLSKATNDDWKAKNPGQVLQEKKEKLKYGPKTKDLYAKAFIDKDAYDLLLKGDPDSVGDFQERRSELIAEHLEQLMIATV